jgi:hypothetical protein
MFSRGWTYTFVTRVTSVSWLILDEAPFLAGFGIVATLIQLLVALLGWWMLKGPVTARPRLVAGSCIASALLFGPLYFLICVPAGVMLLWFDAFEKLLFIWVGSLPLWAMLLPVTLGRLHVWERIRRMRIFCRCGYDLTGNVSGVCPECGCRVRPTVVH